MCQIKVTSMYNFVRNIIRNNKKRCRENDEETDEYLEKELQEVVVGWEWPTLHSRDYHRSDKWLDKGRGAKTQ